MQPLQYNFSEGENYAPFYMRKNQKRKNDVSD